MRLTAEFRVRWTRFLWPGRMDMLEVLGLDILDLNVILYLHITVPRRDAPLVGLESTN